MFKKTSLTEAHDWGQFLSETFLKLFQMLFSPRLQTLKIEDSTGQLHKANVYCDMHSHDS